MASIKRLEVRRSPIYGRGCFALVRLPARKKIAFYAGEVVRGRRLIEARLRRQRAIKIVWLDDDTAIDGAAGGDETAYVNHSCEPNAFMRRVSEEKVAFFALRDISPGEEITVDYRDPDHPEVCRCGRAVAAPAEGREASTGQYGERFRDRGRDSPEF